MQTKGETIYRMYQTILDRRGVAEADKWRDEKLNKGQKVAMSHFKRKYVVDGTIVNRWTLENGG